MPDAKTIWLFREQLTEAGLAGELFRKFEGFPGESGFAARKGQIIDAGIVPAPQQRNSREENTRIKQGEIPQDWEEAKRRQKDTDAQGTKRNGERYYGNKNHVNVDVKHKLIRAYSVTDAAAHDSRVFDECCWRKPTQELRYPPIPPIGLRNLSNCCRGGDFVNGCSARAEKTAAHREGESRQ